MKLPKKKKRTKEEYFETAMTLKDRLAAAIQSDKERIVQGKFGGEKLKLLPRLQEKLSNIPLCRAFLDINGLDLIGEMMYKFPNGEYPSANTRSRVLKMLLNLPVERDHIIKSKVGGFLTFLEKMKNEIKDNKMLVRDIKRKWTRVVLDQHINYRDLEKEQYDLTEAYLRKRKYAESRLKSRENNKEAEQEKRRKRIMREKEESEKDGLQERKNFRATSYDFVYMPKINKLSQKIRRMKEKEGHRRKMEKRTKKVKTSLDIAEEQNE